jgi:FixJ family two-component response regulator
MSGYADNTGSLREILEGGAAFIQKPFTPDLFARTVREVLDSQEPPRA